MQENKGLEAIEALEQIYESVFDGKSATSARGHLTIVGLKE